MEDKSLNEKESIELISRMIRNTQNHLEGNEGISFLIWGYVTLLTTVSVWLGIHFTGSYDWHLLWFAIPVLGLILTKIFTKRQPNRVTTYIDKTVGYVWIVLGSACFLSTALSFITDYTNILSLVLLLIGSGHTITGLIIKYHPVTAGGIISIVLSVVLLFIPGNLDNSLLVFAIAFIAMAIIPGHCLNCKAKKAAKADAQIEADEEVCNV